MTSEILRERLLGVLSFFDIADELGIVARKVDLHENESMTSFVSTLTQFVQSRHGQSKPLDMNCIVSLLCEVTAAWRVKVQKEGSVFAEDVQWSEDSLLQLIALFPFTQPSNRAICKLFDILRSSARFQQQEKARQQTQQNSFSTWSSQSVARWANHTDIPFIPLSLHPHILSVLRRCIAQDDPQHIFFPGDRSSSLQTSPVSMHAKKGFTIASWIKPLALLPSGANPVAGFTLFRGKNPNGDMLDLKCFPLSDEPQRLQQDGKYRFELRCRSEMVAGTLSLPLGRWHLLTICHCAPSEKDSQGHVTLQVDGSVQFEGALPFVKEDEAQATIWTIGQGFRGCVASFAIYEQPMSSATVKFVHSLGPYLTNVKDGVYHAQTSFDTAHQPLGCLYSKGEWSKLCKVRCRFALTPLMASLENVSNYPQERMGKVLPEYINLTSAGGAEEHSVVIVNLSAKCATCLRVNWMESLLEAGGVQLVLYLFWQYSSLRIEPPQPQQSSADEGKPNEKNEEENEENDEDAFVLMGEADEDSAEEEVDAELMRDSLLQCVSLLEILIHSHVEAKEHFLQIHGFHVLASCLSSWTKESVRKVVDVVFIDNAMRLVRALGPDLLSPGDGAASALQGFLFDFRIWSALDLDALVYFLEKMSSVCFDANDALHRFIGVQRILDVFRIHVSKLLVDRERDARAVACADELQRLLILVKDAAFHEAALKKSLLHHAAAENDASSSSVSLQREQEQREIQRQRGNSESSAATSSTTMPTTSNSSSAGLIANETESVLLCLEETNNSLIAERLCRVLENIRNTSPASLRHALFANRFWDTVMVSLWTKRGLSLEVRTHALVNLLWLLAHELRSVPAAMLQLRSEICDAFNASESAKAAAGGLKLRGTLSQQAALVKKCLSRVQEISKGAVYAWKNMLCLRVVLENALRDGLWAASGAVVAQLRSSTQQRFVRALKGLKSTKTAKAIESSYSSSVTATALLMDIEADLPIADSAAAAAVDRERATESEMDADYAFDNLVIAALNEATPQDGAWLTLPLLPALMEYATRETSERVLAQLNVQMKTEDALREVVSAMLPERSWIDVFSRLLLLGVAHHAMDRETQGEREISSLSVTRYGTAAELAIDTLASVVVHKMRLSVDETAVRAMWDSLYASLQDTAQNVISGGDLAAERSLFAETAFLRVICLVLQRLVKLPEEQWTLSLVFACAPLAQLVRDRRLCGEDDEKAPLSSEREKEKDSLPFDAEGDDTIHTAPSLDSLSQRQQQLFRLLLELSHSVRRVSLTRRSGDGREWRVAKSVFSILLDRLSARRVDEANVESVAREIEQHVPLVALSLNEQAALSVASTSSRRGSIGGPAMGAALLYRAAEFKPLVVDTVFALFDYLNALPLSSPVRKRLKQSVERLLIFFRDESVRALTENLVVDSAVQRVATTLGKHAGSPLDLVYKVLCAEWRDDVIRFTEDEREREKDEPVMVPRERESERERQTADKDFETVDRQDVLAATAALAASEATNAEAANAADAATHDLLDFTPLDLLDFSFAMASESERAQESAPCTADSLVSAAEGESDAFSPSLAVSPSATATFELLVSPVVDHSLSVTEREGESAAKRESHKDKETDRERAGQNEERDKFRQWLIVRQGISAERVDSERARMTQSMRLCDVSLAATRAFWRRERRKVEAEAFLQAHRCHWKLGVAHEGPFYGRKRVILRPRFENLYATRTFESAMRETLSELEARENESESERERERRAEDEELLERALVHECSGYIRDVTRSESEIPLSLTAENESESDLPASSAADAANSGDAALAAANAAAANAAVPTPGTGWGIVDADGSEDGFGVVGLANATTTTTATASEKLPKDRNIAPAGGAVSSSKDGKPTVGNNAKKDALDELHLLEEKEKFKRRPYDTAPVASGTSKCEDASLVKMESRVVLVTASGNCWGLLAFTADEIFFRSSIESDELRQQDSAAVNLCKGMKMRRRRWRIDAVSAVYLRRYRLRDSALEIFFRKGKHRNVFVDFGHTREDAKTRAEFAKALTAIAPTSAFKQSPTMSPLKMVIDHGVQDKWLEGKMSNFDYLMALNTIAGRSYNDLCQYPVMPWVLSDYTSSTLDLRDPRVYRDLSKPMGALNESRLKEFLDRFHSFEESNVTTGIPAFMYGSHYSTMVGVVLHFLVRLQPFAALHQEMQTGHFDVPDRLFSSVPRSFLHNTTQLSEVKEITPEWFTTPEMFRNVNRFDFGTTQDGLTVDHVELPPWARDSPEEFVRLNRAALESEYVTEHLHEWIDLIFGYKQRGPESILACNVFYYLTYYGAVDPYAYGAAAQDEARRRATELQIAHFGQVPLQLFKTPHPQRSSRSRPPLTRSLFKAVEEMERVVRMKRESEKERERERETKSVREKERDRERATNALLAMDEEDLLGLSLDDVDNAFVEFSERETEREPYTPTQTERERFLSLSDEEQLSLFSPCTLVVRKTEQRVVVSLTVLADRLLCVLDNGVLEVLRYAASEEARSALSAALASRAALANAGAAAAPGAAQAQGGRRGSTASAPVVAPSPSVENLLFGDAYDWPSPPPPPSTASSGAASAARRPSAGSRAASPGAPRTAPLSAAAVVPTLPPGASLFAVEKEYAHFDVVPKVPLPPRPARAAWHGAAPHSAPHGAAERERDREQEGEREGLVVTALDHGTRLLRAPRCALLGAPSFAEHQARLVVLDRAARLCFSYGRADGVVSVREVDAKSGALRSGGDFGAHRRRVVALCCDTCGAGGGAISSAAAVEYDVVASLDESGQLFVWTVLYPRSNTAVGESERSGFAMERRPQKAFRVSPVADVALCLSTHMCVVVAVAGPLVYLFSLERNELLRTFYLHDKGEDEDEEEETNVENDVFTNEDEKKTLSRWNRLHHIKGSAFNGPLEHVFGHQRHSLHDKTENYHNIGDNYVQEDKRSRNKKRVSLTRRAVLSDCGVLVVHIETFSHEESLLEFEDALVSQHALLAYSLSGTRCGVALSLSAVSALCCPDRGESVLAGHRDGSVVVYQAQNLQVLHRIEPSAYCVQYSLALPGAAPSNASSSSARNTTTSKTHSASSHDPFHTQSHTHTGDSSAIVAISVGPNPHAPAVLVLSTEAGNLYLVALPDFLRWERNRAPSALAQLASVPLQAVKGTLLQAAETAGVFAQNAKSFADDALSEIKKMRKNSLVKGMASFFGVKGGSDDA